MHQQSANAYWSEHMAKCAVMKDLLWSIVNELPLGAAAPFTSVEGDEDDGYQTLFKDNREAHQPAGNYEDASGEGWGYMDRYPLWVEISEPSDHI